jgi:hypothetical protein
MLSYLSNRRESELIPRRGVFKSADCPNLARCIQELSAACGIEVL